jgi:hypothetical protein
MANAQLVCSEETNTAVRGREPSVALLERYPACRDEAKRK